MYGVSFSVVNISRSKKVDILVEGCSWWREKYYFYVFIWMLGFSYVKK